MKKRIILLCTLVTMMVAMFLVGCGKKNDNRIDLNSYLKYEVTGYNGYGKVDVSFAFIDFFEDNESYFKNESIDCVYFPDPTVEDKNLSNGDKYEIKWNDSAVANFAKEYGMKLKYQNITETVSGLEEIKKVDIFEGVEIEYDGIAPYAKAHIKNNSKYKEINYALSNTNGIANGDKITVTASTYGNIDDYLIKEGCIAESTTKEYLVEGLSHYVAELSEINQKIDDSIYDNVKDKLTAEFASTDGKEVLNSVEFIGNYLLTPKKTDSEIPIYLYYVYKINASNTEISDFTYYYYAKFSNPIVLEDGTCSIDTLDFKVPESGWFTSELYKPISDGKYAYGGYGNIDSLFNKCVASNVDKYKYESTVNE